MFTMYIKVNRKTVLGLACAALVVACGVVGVKMGLNAMSVKTMASDSPALSLKKADDNTKRVEFLTSLGYEVEQEPCEIEEVVIPLEFDAVYLKYNELQMTQGFDLTELCGKRVKRYSYVVTNYEGEPDGARANLLVYKGRLVGGDVCSVRLDGFMHGLRMPASTGISMDAASSLPQAEDALEETEETAGGAEVTAGDAGEASAPAGEEEPAGD